MVTGEGKTLVATLPAYLNALHGPGRPHRHGERLPGPARPRVDGPGVRDCWGSRWGRSRRRWTPSERIPSTGVRHHLRHEQRVRLRLPARQHEDPGGGRRSSARSTSRSWTRWTRSSSTRRARRSSFSGPAEERPTSPSTTEADEQSTRRLQGAARGLRGQGEGAPVRPDRRGHREGRAARRRARSTRAASRDWPHLIEQALRAHHIYKRDHDYVVKDGEIIIVDEFTGRLMEGRRWSDGLHQAVEAKEGIRVARGEPDPRHDHLPELLQALQEARRHDRHGHDRGRRVLQDLQARRRRDPHEPAADPRHGAGRRHLPHGEGEVRRGRRGDRGGPPDGPAHPRRHD